MGGIKNCETCGKEIAKNAKACPSCGAKNKKPIYKRPWFIVCMVLLFFFIVGGTGGTESVSTSADLPEQTSTTNTETHRNAENIEYVSYDVKTLIDDLNSNALKAEQTYANKYVEIKGRLSVIDSDGSYISLAPQDEIFSFYSVQCFLTNEQQLDKVLEMSIDDIIVLKGQITEVGEVLGYMLDIDSIE